MCAQAEGVFDITTIGGGAQNDGGNDAIIRMLIDPLENVETAGAGHLQIKDQDVWERVKDAVVERRISVHVLDGFDSIVNDMGRSLEAAFFECPLEDEGIVLIILGNQD